MAMRSFGFEILGEDGGTGARLGRMTTPHGEVTTPAFLPVGTRGTVKAMAPWELSDIGFQMVLANTYHLYLRPGSRLIERAGGIHAFMGWDGPLLTDSGGFQVFSLSKTLRVEEEGVVFRSVYDGSEHLFTPEKAVRVQEEMGSDIAMILDRCVEYPCPLREAERSVELTSQWARRSLGVHSREEQVIFGIVQGGVYPELRARSAMELKDMGFPGYGIGGLSVGEPRETMLSCIEIQDAILPRDRPRHLLGIGDPEGMLQAVARGMDLFDCVLPTRMARNGTALTRRGKMNLRNNRYGDDLRALEDNCPCPACTRLTRAYLRHLHRNNEILAHHLLTWHNLSFMQRLMVDCRAAIEAGRMLELIDEWRGWSDGSPGE